MMHRHRHWLFVLRSNAVCTYHLDATTEREITRLGVEGGNIRKQQDSKSHIRLLVFFWKLEWQHNLLTQYCIGSSIQPASICIAGV